MQSVYALQHSRHTRKIYSPLISVLCSLCMHCNSLDIHAKYTHHLYQCCAVCVCIATLSTFTQNILTTYISVVQSVYALQLSRHTRKIYSPLISVLCSLCMHCNSLDIHAKYTHHLYQCCAVCVCIATLSTYTQNILTTYISVFPSEQDSRTHAALPALS